MRKKILFSELSDKLSTTVDVCERFQTMHKGHFRNFPLALDKLKGLIAAFEELNGALKRCAKQYEILSKDVSLVQTLAAAPAQLFFFSFFLTLAMKLELRLNNDTHENGKSQRRIALEGKHLNRLLIVSTQSSFRKSQVSLSVLSNTAV